MLNGYMEENKKYTKAIAVQKDLEEKLKGAAAQSERDAKIIEELEMKLLKEGGKVLVTDGEEPTM